MAICTPSCTICRCGWTKDWPSTLKFRGENHGVNRPHVQLLTERLQRRQWRPDLARLHGLSRLEDMKQLDYAEAWLWTHFLLESSELRLTLVQNYLARLRMKGESAPLMKYLAEAEPDVHAELVKHLLAFDDAQPDFE
jgi:hypothetical protein